MPGLPTILLTVWGRCVESALSRPGDKHTDGPFSPDWYHGACPILRWDIQAFLENSVVRVRLSNLLLKALLNQQAGALEDLELFDQDLHRNLTWMLKNDITGVRLLFNYFD